MIRSSEDDVMDEEEDVIIDVTRCDNMNQRYMNHCDINITSTRDHKSTFSYSLAKEPPHQNLTIEQLTQKFGTLNFLPAFSTFLRLHLPGTTITPTFRDRFNAYKQIVISLPTNRYLGERVLMDRVRTAPAVKASGRALAKAPHFDTAFVVEDLPLYKSEGGLSGVFFFQTNIALNLTFFLLCRSSCCSNSINILTPAPVRNISSSNRLC
jgi:hypothetical protein